MSESCPTINRERVEDLRNSLSEDDIMRAEKRIGKNYNEIDKALIYFNLKFQGIKLSVSELLKQYAYYGITFVYYTCEGFEVILEQRAFSSLSATAKNKLLKGI